MNDVKNPARAGDADAAVNAAVIASTDVPRTEVQHPLTAVAAHPKADSAAGETVPGVEHLQDNADADERCDSPVTKADKKIGKPPRGLAWRSSDRLIIFTVAVAVFTDIFLYGLIVPVFPFSLSERIGIAEDKVQHWISVLLAVYGAGLLAGSPVCGWFADHTKGRMLPFMVGLVVLIGSTAMLCVGNSIAILVVGRLLQGMSGAVVWVVGLALLVDTVGRERVGESMGVVSVALSLGMFLGPLLGGIVYDKGGYYAVFGMAFGLLAVDVFLRLIIIEKKVAIQYGITAPPTETIVSPRTPSPVPENPSLWYRIHRRLPPVFTLLGHPRLLAALWGTVVQAILTTSCETTIPLYLHEIWGWNSVGAGLIFLAICVPTFASPIVGKVVDRIGPRVCSTTGFILGCPFLILLRIVDHNSIGQKVTFVVLLFIFGTAMMLVITPFLTEISLVVLDLEDKKPGRFGKNGAIAQAYGLFNLSFAAGTMVGPLIGGFIKAAKGWKTEVLVLGIICGSTAIPVVIYTGGKLGWEDFRHPKILRRKKKPQQGVMEGLDGQQGNEKV